METFCLRTYLKYQNEALEKSQGVDERKKKHKKVVGFIYDTHFMVSVLHRIKTYWILCIFVNLYIRFRFLIFIDSLSRDHSLLEVI